MKKNNISIDIVSFGEPSAEDVQKLTAFNEAVKGSEGSYLGIIPPSPNLLSDTLISTPIFGSESSGASRNGAAEGGESSNSNNFEFGVDPELDPELALALRMSYEEEKLRQEKEKKAKEEAEAKEKLEGIPEADERDPLLGEEKAGSSSKDNSKDDKKEDKKDDGDKMDTA